MNATDIERQVDVSGVKLVLLVVTMAWVAIMIPLMIGLISFPDLMGNKSAALTCLLATLAFSGAAASWFYRRAGVYVHVAAVSGMILNGVLDWSRADGATFPVVFLILLIVYLVAVIKGWDKFEA